MVWARVAQYFPLAFLLWAMLPFCIRGEQQFEGKRVVDIVFSPPGQPVALADLQRAVTLKKGEALHMDDVRQTIENLFATGGYEDIQVDAEPSGDGVNVRFITRNSWFVGRVSVEGNVAQPPNRGQMVNAARLNLGMPFHEEDMAQAETGLRRLLLADGFFETRIQQRIDYDPTKQQAHIHFMVSSGVRAKYRTPVMNGNLKMAVDTLISAAKWRRWFMGGWRPVTQSRTRQGVANIRRKYQDQQRLMAKVRLRSMDYERDTGRATPVLEIDAGPRINIQAIGAKVPEKKLRQNVPIFEEQTVDRDLLVEGQRNLRDAFQMSGYFEADVEFKEQALRNDTQEIDYLINLGSRHQLVHIGIQGNQYFTTETIRERMFVTPKSLQLRHGRYSEALMRRDEDAIAGLYKENGFRDVRVTSKVEDNYKGKSGDLAVFITIEEGPQWFVSALDIAGIHQLDASSVTSALSSSQGQPFSEFSVAADRDAILAYYFANGFPNASFEWSSKPGLKPNQVDLRFVITEGQRQFVRDVLVEGLETTRPALVARNLLLASGDPLSPIRMADTQRRLYDLGIFAQVEMAIQNQEGQTQHKYVVYSMEEAKKWSFDGGIGAEIARLGTSETSLDAPGGGTGFSPRVSFGISRLNFLGLGHTISLQTRISTIQQRAILNYLFPRFQNHENLDLSFSGTYDATHDVNTFSAKREEGSVQLSQKLSKPSTLLYQFSYRRVSTSDLKIDPNLVPLLSQPVRVGIFSMNYIQDRRDNPIDATKGIYNTVDVGVATKGLGSQVSFGRGLARNATYHRLGKRIVLARQLTFGDILPFNYDTQTTTVLNAVPFPERFFSGGDNSNRAFPQNQAGPRDLKTGFPIGGTAMLFHTTELRFPLIGANIGGVLFHDAGNVYSSLDNLSFRVHQRNVQDFDYMVHAVGLGVRYRTPIGPVRFDLAYSLNPPSYFGCKGNINDLLACGNDPALRTDHSIGHLQFFFSIGQTF